MRQRYSNGHSVFSVYLMHCYVNSKPPKTTKILLSEFNYLINWPIWEDSKLSMRVSINDCLTRFKECSDNYKAIERADLSYPIICTKSTLGLYLVIDGHHRIGKATLLKKLTISAYVLNDPALFDKFKIGPDTEATHQKLNHMTKAQLVSLRKKRLGL